MIIAHHACKYKRFTAEQCVIVLSYDMPNKEKQPTCFDIAAEGVAYDIRNEPEPASWIRRVGTPGDYYGQGRVLHLPYQSFLVLIGYDRLQGEIDPGYAFYSNMMAIRRLEWACPYKGAVVMTDVPLPQGGKGTFTLVG